jgi:hypothetical protein
MTRAPKKPTEARPVDEEISPAGATPGKGKVQFGPTPSAPGSRLKKKGA